MSEPTRKPTPQSTYNSHMRNSSKRNSTECANAIRALSMDAVQRANSGHPGMPMGMADLAEVLWNEFLVHNPRNPQWTNRDRFILSNGHGSMLQYSLLHLSGYDLSIDDLKQFRQLHSKTPGHPENGITPGVETTTGPLGQGIGNAVGMALAEKLLAQHFNRPGFPIVDHHTYAFAGDGCLMEGISHEVCSLAATLKLGKLIVLYDDNGISIDGPVRGWFTDDTAARFAAYDWQVIQDIDGHDSEAVSSAIKTARADINRPTLILCKTVIGFGSPSKAGTEGSHGAPLGNDEIDATRQNLNWPHAAFDIPNEIYQVFDARDDGAVSESQWMQLLATYKAKFPKLGEQFQRRCSFKLPSDWNEHIAGIISDCATDSKTVATRKASERILNALGPVLPELIGGSADLSGSNNTRWSGSEAVEAETGGNYVNYGVREFGMAAIMNGIALHGGYIPYAGTFLVFSDYARNAIRMASITRSQSIFVLTHDSIGLGEDGPTHQPIEHLASLRQIPGVQLWRPCDLTETAVAWKSAIEYRDGPTCIALSRQSLPAQSRISQTITAIDRGGYVLQRCQGQPDLILIATGSEIQLALAVYAQLVGEGMALSVVSMPCTAVFDRQDQAYRESVLPNAVRNRISIEAGVSDYWRKYVGLDGEVVGLDCFGESAPAEQLFEHFGFTVNAVSEKARQLCARANKSGASHE